MSMSFTVPLSTGNRVVWNNDLVNRIAELMRKGETSNKALAASLTRMTGHHFTEAMMSGFFNQRTDQFKKLVPDAEHLLSVRKANSTVNRHKGPNTGPRTTEKFVQLKTLQPVDFTDTRTVERSLRRPTKEAQAESDAINAYLNGLKHRGQ